MNTNGTAAYAMYPRTVALPEVVCALNRAGFDNMDICMILSPAHPDAEVVREATVFHCKPSERATTARMIDWFSKLGAVVIPTVGLFARSHSFLQALTEEPRASMVPRRSQLLLALGFSPEDAERLGQQLCDFGALVYVSCPDSMKTDGVIELLKDAGAREAACLALFEAFTSAA